MTAHPLPEIAKHVPAQMPTVEVRPLDMPPFEVTLRELLWWYIVPEVGDRALWLSYEEPGWTLSGYTRLDAVGPARIHRTPCVRIVVTEWERPGLDAPWTGPREKIIYARQTDEQTHWMAVEEEIDGVHEIFTFQDKGFDLDFGTVSRRIDTTGRLEELEPGVFRYTAERDDRESGPLAAGVFEVRIGENRFVCLRVWDIGECWQTRRARALEAFVTREGRTVLTRHYRHPAWASEQDWLTPWTGGRPFDEAFPDHARITINGTPLVHWYNDLTGAGLGQARAPRSDSA